MNNKYNKKKRKKRIHVIVNTFSLLFNFLILKTTNLYKGVGRGVAPPSPHPIFFKQSTYT